MIINFRIFLNNIKTYKFFVYLSKINSVKNTYPIIRCILDILLFIIFVK